MMGATKRLALLIAAAACLAGTGRAYYHFVHYASRFAPFTPIPEKFDLNALPNRTVYFFVSAQAPTQLAPNDTFAGVLSQISLAARTWNDVSTSELRVAFGGLFSAEAPRATPAIEVVFDELAPGVLAMGAPVLRADLTAGASGSFVPITRSLMVLRRDLSDRPSFTDGFFLTAVHELGHTLGLQHALTSSVMSTDVTRASTRAKPLGADDVAAISLLYPARGYAARVGGIAGRVTMSTGEGAALASVVAVNPGGEAVSALTHPDGTYRIEGLSPGQYYVYVHPLPPSPQPDLGPAAIVLPVDQLNRAFPAGDLFETLFYPGTKNPEQALTIFVNAGMAAEGINFTVRRRGALQLHGVTTYSFPGSVAVKPAFLNINGPRLFLLASSEGMGLTSGGAPLPTLSVTVLGGAAAVAQTRAYSQDPRFLQVDFGFNPLSGPGPRHLVFSYNSDLYVLPSGLNAVNRQPPLVSSVTSELDVTGNRLAVVTGTNLGPDTRILFDGVQAAVRSAEEGRVVVVPPPAAGGHRANVIALASDGQSSLFLQGRTPPTFAYEPGDAPGVLLSQSALAAGAESMVEITGINTSFSEDTRVGFGSSDVVVRRTWVLSPTRLLANVAVAPSAAAGSTLVSVVTGLQVSSQPFGFQVQPANSQLPVISSQLVNPANGQPGVFPGGLALLQGSNFSSNPAELNLTLNGTRLSVQPMAPGQLLFQIPATFPTGPAVLRLQSGTEQSYPVVVAIDLPPPVIAGLGVGTAPLPGTTRPVRVGEVVTLVVNSLAEPGAVIAPGRVRVTVGGVEIQASAVSPAPQPGYSLVQFTVTPSVAPGPQVPLSLSIDGRASQPFMVTVQAA